MLVEIAMVGIKILVSAQPLQTNTASSCHCGGAVDRTRDERWGAPVPGRGEQWNSGNLETAVATRRGSCKGLVV